MSDLDAATLDDGTAEPSPDAAVIDGSAGGRTASGADACAPQPSSSPPEPVMGCACEPSTAPRSCDPPDQRTVMNGVSGTLVCGEGSAFCRQGVWSACEILYQFAVFVPD